MKRVIISSTALMLIAASVLADPAEIIKQKALAIRDANNARQQAIAGGGGSAPAPTPQYTAPQAPAGPAASQQALIDRLQRDFNSIKQGPSTLEEANGLETDMTALAKGSTKPTKAELSKLSTDLAAALAEKPLPSPQMALLARDINIAENCSVITSARALTFVSGAQTVLRNNGVSSQNVENVTEDLTAIVNEIQKAKPKLYQ